MVSLSFDNFPVLEGSPACPSSTAGSTLMAYHLIARETRMARVPVISSPCPMRWREAPKPGADFCGQCQRRVHNLDLMSMAEREAFLQRCTGEVCVSYTVRRPASLPLAVGFGLAALAVVPITNANDSADAPPYEATVENSFALGGTRAGDKLQWVDESEAQLPEKADLPDIEPGTWLPTPEN